MSKLNAKARLIARPEVTDIMLDKAVTAANEQIERLSAKCEQLGVSKELVTQYIGNFLHSEILPGIELGVYDGHKAEEMLKSITALKIAQHMMSGDPAGPAEIHQHGTLMANDQQYRMAILKKLGLSPHEFHALSMMILSEAKKPSV